MPYQTRNEEIQMRQEVTLDVLSIMLGIFRKLMPENDRLKMYTALAGDTLPEARARVGTFCADVEHAIDRKVARQRLNIERCYRFALKSTTSEERDTWNDQIRIHVSMINELQDLRTSTQRLLTMVAPWPELARMALLGERTGRPNLVPIAPSTQRNLDAILQSATTPPPPPGQEQSEQTEEGAEPRDQSQPTS